MNNQPARRVDKVSKTIAAAPEKVYQAILNPNALATWLPPTGMTGQIDHYEPWEGGSFQMTLMYTDAEYAQAGKTTENKDVTKGILQKLVPNQQIVWGGNFETEDETLQEPMSLTWQLDEVSADTTNVTITVENVPETLNRQDHEDVLNSTLENLAHYVAQQKD